jgi:hypothetical protein
VWLEGEEVRPRTLFVAEGCTVVRVVDGAVDVVRGPVRVGHGAVQGDEKVAWDRVEGSG